MGEYASAEEAWKAQVQDLKDKLFREEQEQRRLVASEAKAQEALAALKQLVDATDTEKRALAVQLNKAPPQTQTLRKNAKNDTVITNNLKNWTRGARGAGLPFPAPSTSHTHTRAGPPFSLLPTHPVPNPAPPHTKGKHTIAESKAYLYQTINKRRMTNDTL